jgi:acetoin utilization protein AcuB
MKLVELRREKTRTGDIMNKNVLTIAPDVDIYEAVKIMKTNRVGGLPVVEDENLIGIITERDIVNSFIV